MLPQEPRPRGQATGRTRRNEEQKNSEKMFSTSKVKVLEILATQKSSLNFENNVLLRCFEDFELVEDHCCLWCSIEAVSAMFAIKMYLELKHTPVLENKYTPTILGHHETENINPRFCFFAEHGPTSNERKRKLPSTHETCRNAAVT